MLASAATTVTQDVSVLLIFSLAITGCKLPNDVHCLGHRLLSLLTGGWGLWGLWGLWGWGHGWGSDGGHGVRGGHTGFGVGEVVAHVADADVGSDWDPQARQEGV